MKIVKISEDKIRKPIVHFDDGVTVWFLRPGGNHNQPGPGVEPAMPPSQARPYIKVAQGWQNSPTETITDRQFDSYARRLERRNLKDHNQSPAATSISRAAHPWIVDIQSDRGLLVVREGWREAMKHAAIVKIPWGLLR